MTTAELKEYLGVIVQMEKEVDLQERLWQQLHYKEKQADDKIKQLTELIENPKDKIEAPEKPQISMPKRGTANAEKAQTAIFVGPIVIVATIFVFYLLTNVSLYMGLVNSLLCLLFLAGIAGSIYFGVGSIGALLSYSNEVKKDEQKYTKEMEQYEAEMQHYKEEVKKYENAKQAEQAENLNRKKQIEKLKIEKQMVKSDCLSVVDSLWTSRKRLEEMYNYNILFPKYRNYVMVSSLYEYLSAGRCTTLEGHEGAYNILELEIRLDRIITQLNDVLNNLLAIQKNQYMLYSCLMETNCKISELLSEERKMVDGLGSLGIQLEGHTEMMSARIANPQKSSELTNYLTECNQRELHYMNRMNYLAGNYDNPYGNYAPV